MIKRTTAEDKLYKRYMKSKSALKRIRCKCLDCCCYSFKEVKLCTTKDCPLWEFRFGHRPK